MPARRRYVKRADRAVVAVQLALETAGVTYRKRGGVQTCKAGDYLVFNEEQGGDAYAVTSEKFEAMYEPAE